VRTRRSTGEGRVKAADEVPATTDLAGLKRALERVGVEHRSVSGISEVALLLAGGSVLRFDLEGRYLGATTGDDAPESGRKAAPHAVPEAAVPAVEDGRGTSPIYIGGDEQADDTTALLQTRGQIARRQEGGPPSVDGAREDLKEDLKRLARVMPAGGPLVVEGEAASGVARNISGATSDLRLVELWLSGKSEASRRAYLSDLTKFFEVISEDEMGLAGAHPKALREITLSDLHEFAAFISELWAPRTQVRMLATVKSLFSFAQKTGYLPHNVGAALELPSVKDDLAERDLSEGEVHRMIAGEKNRRNRILLLTLYAGGLRREDACSLKWRDVKERPDVGAGYGQITVFGKGGKTGNILLPPSVFREISTLKTTGNAKADTLADPKADTGEDPTPARIASADDPVFVSRKKQTARSGHLDPSQINRIVRAAARRAGISEPVSPHWLRHSHATHASQRGADLALIRDTLRHASIATTGRYLHSNPTKSSAMYLPL